VNTTLDNVQQATLKLNTTDNSLGLLLNDTALYGNLNTTVNSATNLLEDLKENPHRYVHFSLIGRKK
ncbi:MAG: MCE family protein, partial [Bacteroidaceae bacterium]|nr:MCE family protein [Bacteroidaceae bacterium]